jgi:hypothetical protein
MKAGAMVAVVWFCVSLPIAAVAARLATADLPWLDPEEAAALLADLEEAGLLPADLDLPGLGLPGRSEDAEPTRSSWSCRLETTHDGRARASLDGRAGPVGVRLRARRGLEGPPQAGGCVWAEDPSWAVAVGGVGVQHGLGLLAAGPGRNRTASVAGSLLPGDNGPRYWSSPDAASGVRGLVAEWRTGVVSAGAMVGRLEETPGRGFTAERAAWLAVRREGLVVSALACPGPNERGQSLAVAVSKGRLDLQAEATAWRDRASAGSATATAAAARWRGKRIAIEALAATSAAPAGPRFGSRPACLIGWDGRGWAVRGRVALSAALTGTFLVASAEDHPSRTTAQDRASRQTLEAGVTGRLAPGATWAVRWRRREDLRWVQNEAAPWQPPRCEGQEVTDAYVAEASMPVGGGDLGGALRSASREITSGRGRRSVASLRWRGPCGPLRATVGGSWAWGDPVAVSTVTTPVAGLAVPRSWSQWSAEIHAGAELAVGPWRIQLAAARRTDALLPPGPATWEGWLRLAMTW